MSNCRTLKELILLSDDELMSLNETAIFEKKSQSMISMYKKDGLRFTKIRFKIFCTKKDLIEYKKSKKEKVKKVAQENFSNGFREHTILEKEFESALTVKVPQEELWQFIEKGARVEEAANHFNLKPRVVRRAIERMEVMKDKLLITRI